MQYIGRGMKGRFELWNTSWCWWRACKGRM